MGLGQDLINEGMWEAHQQEIKYERLCSLAERGFWRTKDNRLLKISEMSKEHLLSILKMLQKYNDGVLCKAYAKKMLEEYKSR